MPLWRSHGHQRWNYCSVCYYGCRSITWRLSANQAARCYLPTAEWTDADWLQRRLDFISRGGAAAGALLGDVTDLIKRATATDDQYQLLRHQIATMLPSCLLRYESLRHELVEVNRLTRLQRPASHRTGRCQTRDVTTHPFITCRC